LLGNGKVLVVGGSLAAELYDPATGEWSLTADASVRRVDHTATLLLNGKVLVAGGGLRDGLATNTAELFDPATGKWSLTGNLSRTRLGQGATLLQEGKVLVTGGCGDEDCNFELASSELYDPDSETWSLTGSLNSVRYANPALERLSDGNVLAVGGTGRFPYDRAELYNPATGRWSYTASLPNHRAWESVTLLPNGDVLAAGGTYFAGPGPGNGVFNSALLYNPATGSWNVTASLNAARSGHSATLLHNGKALIVGGFVGTNTTIRSAELYCMTGPGALVSVSAASFHLTGLSSDSLATSLGTGLATASVSASTLPLPTEIAGTTVKVNDSAGIERLAPLLHVSPTQVNYLIPLSTALGAATVTITSGTGTVSSSSVMIKPVAPSLFAANSDGQGVAAALALRVKSDGSQTYEEVVQFDAAQNKFTAQPVDLGPEGDQVYLVLFGTGIRTRSSLSSVIATIGSTYSAVSFAGAQPEFAGVDQVNVLVPRSLVGRGGVDVLLTVDAQMANPVRIHIK